MGPVARTRVGMTAVATGTVRRLVITTAEARAVIDAGVSGPAPEAGTGAIPGAVAAIAGTGPAAVRRAADARSGRRGATATTSRVADRDRTAATGLPAAATTAAARGGAATTAARMPRAARGAATAIDVDLAAAAIGRAKAA